MLWLMPTCGTDADVDRNSRDGRARECSSLGSKNRRQSGGRAGVAEGAEGKGGGRGAGIVIIRQHKFVAFVINRIIFFAISYLHLVSLAACGTDCSS